MPKLNLVFFLFFFIVALVFILYPQIDLVVSSYFYHQGFNKQNIIYDFIYDGTRYLMAFIILSTIILLILSFFNKTFLNLSRKKLFFLLLSAILGPGIIVNGILKDHWGRARPVHIKQFGGTKKFTPAFVISKQCDTNCSFTCGHASVGFFLVAFAFLYRKKAKEIFLFSLIMGFIIGFVRIAQGGHFLSDVIFSFFFVYVSIRFLYFILFSDKYEIK